MDKPEKQRNVLLLVFELVVIMLGIGGITFAVSKLLNDRSQIMVKTDEYNVDYVGDKDIVATNLEPISDSLVNYNTSNNVVRVEFSLKGVSTNKNNKDLIYDIMINDINIDCSLLNEYTKWNLYKNGELISNGSLSPSFDGDILGDSMRLTTIQQDLPDYKDEYDNYVLIFWISEACDDLTTCKRIDQSDIANSSLSMKVFVALYSGDKQQFVRIPNYDTSCANRPNLSDNMIPVTYKNGNWVVASNDNSSSEYLWYNYSKQVWANAVMTKSGSYDKVGTIVNKDDILGYYVWIPRYRYKLWKVDNSDDTYNAMDNGVEIQFEGGVSTTSGSKNGEYLTHPSFGKDMRGFWVSKYEISNNNGIKFVDGVSSYRGQELDDYKNIISSLSDKMDSHIINNLEWGSILYLSHSKYGVCSGDGCSKVDANSSYVAGSNRGDTTTKNVFGVYDMAGGASEYVVGEYSIGNAMDEVMNNNGTWYDAHSINSHNDYAIRGGCDRGLFYFGDIAMDNCDYSTRAVLVNK